MIVTLIIGGGGLYASGIIHRRHKSSETTRITIQFGKPACSVDVDGAAVGKTDARGNLTLTGVSASDHYLHVDCPGEPEMTYFISPTPGSATVIEPKASFASDGTAGAPPLAAAENNMELRRLLDEAVNERGEGQFPGAVQSLRQAIQLDPDNPGLHHELGMTFLMIRDWSRAEVELREAIRHDPSSAGAHNGLGYALEKLGDLQGALVQFRTAMHLDPNDRSYEDQYVEVLGLIGSEQGSKKKKRK